MKNCVRKRVLVTGASRGIGKAAMIELAARGYDVTGVCLHSKEKLEGAAEEARAFGVNVLAISGVDVGDYEDVRKNVYEYLKSMQLAPDCIINNAGISYAGLLQDMDICRWNQIIATNLTSVFNTAKLFLPDMIRRGSGRILNVSSVWGSAGASLEAAYSASKGGVDSLTKALAKELAPSGIQVNAAAFGVIDTEMNNHLTDEEKRSLREEIPMGRFGTAQEAAALLADILEAPPYLTGQIITMDGGWI